MFYLLVFIVTFFVVLLYHVTQSASKSAVENAKRSDGYLAAAAVSSAKMKTGYYIDTNNPFLFNHRHCVTCVLFFVCLSLVCLHNYFSLGIIWKNEKNTLILSPQTESPRCKGGEACIYIIGVY